MKRPLVLVSNDDGIEAAGVHRLVDWLSPMADIVCVCPERRIDGYGQGLA